MRIRAPAPPLSALLKKAGGQSCESSSCQRGAYDVGLLEAACALYAATMASLSAFALPLPGCAGRRWSKYRRCSLPAPKARKGKVT